VSAQQECLSGLAGMQHTASLRCPAHQRHVSSVLQANSRSLPASAVTMPTLQHSAC
jgi:hypothetical protein